MRKALALAILWPSLALAQAPRNNLATTTYMPGGSLGAMMYFNSSGFPVNLAPNTSATQQCLAETGTGVSGNAPVWVSCGGGSPTGPAGGDLAGTYPNPSVFQAHLTDQAVPTPPSSGTLILASFNQQGFSVPHIYDTQGNAIEITRDMLVVVRNTSGSTINRGQVVYVTGTTGTVATVALAKADSALTMPATGTMYETTANNGYGRMMVTGVIEHIDMSAYSNGDHLFVSDTTAGSLVNTPPATYPQMMGIVLNNGIGNGVFLCSGETDSEIGWGDSAGGDLGGAYPNPTVVGAHFAGNIDFATFGLTEQLPNNGTTGTATNETVAITASGDAAVFINVAGAPGVIGVCVSGCGTSGTAKIAIAGQVSCVFDGATSAGDFVGISTTNGECRDLGATIPVGTRQLLGWVTSSHVGAGTYSMWFMPTSLPSIVNTMNSLSGALAITAGPGVTVTPSGSNIQITASNAAAAQWRQEGFVADGVHNTYTLLSAPITNGILYVNENGVTLGTTAWSLSTATVTITSTPGAGVEVDIGYFSNSAPAGSPFVDEFTYSGSSSFVLSFTPISGGILAVKRNGQTLSTTGWTVGGSTVNVSVTLFTGDLIDVAYLH